MSDKPQIASLVSVSARTAWANEAYDFTPWLYENLDALGKEIGIALEQEGVEVSVQSFSADILARNKHDGSRVLIENQLECSDHTHLGQILTYLAGLDAKTVIWVATDFREPHLSAVNWLNENTSEAFAFFAVKLKVVRIADSPLAPIFEIVARPNGWERRLHTVREGNAVTSELSLRRFAFWEEYVKQFPSEVESGGPATYSSYRWRVLDDLNMIISIYTANTGVGIYVRAGQSSSSDDLRARLERVGDVLSRRLGCEVGGSDRFFFIQESKGDYTDKAQQPVLCQWLKEKADLYESVLRELFAGN